MIKKTILMTPEMVKKIETITKERDITISEFVREAVDAFEDYLTKEEEAFLGRFIDEVVKMTNETANRVDAVLKRTDETLTYLKQQRPKRLSHRKEK